MRKLRILRNGPDERTLINVVTRTKKATGAKKVATAKVAASKAAGGTKEAAGAKTAAARKTGTAVAANLSHVPAGRAARAAETPGRDAGTAARADRNARRTAGKAAARNSAGARTREAASAVAALLLEADPDEAARVVDLTIKEEPHEPLDPALWGPPSSKADIAAGMVANLRKRFEGRQAVVAASVSRAEVAQLLGTSKQAVTDYLETHRLVGFKQGRRWLIPAWQLDPETERGVLPGLDLLLAVFPDGVVALSRWVNRPSEQLNGHTPRELLVKGDIDPVIGAAGQLTAAGW